MAVVPSLCLVFTVITKLNAARILVVVPTPSISHQFVFRPLTQELARIGHDVTVITADPAFEKNQAPPNLTEIDTHDISYKAWDNELRKIGVGDENDMIEQVRMFIHLFGVIFGQQLQMKEIQDLIQQKPHFDLIIAELCTRPAIIFSHIFNAPMILMSSFGAMLGTHTVVGAPSHPLLQPAVCRQRLYNLTMWEKIREIYFQLRFEHMYSSYESEENAMLKKILGDNIPKLSELYNNVNVVFLNVHPIWNDNQPVPPGVVYVGGIHQKPAKKLPQGLETYLNSSEHGVIYLSFGTNVKPSVLPPDKVRMMMKVFSELPYNVIMKWDIELPNKPKNIKVFKWLPQSDLLQHPNIKLFITQGGLQSTDEAITGKVPLIGIPVIGDQWYNVEKYVKHGIGKKLEMGAFTEEDFKTAVLEVIEDPSYKNNIIRLRTLMRDEPLTPLERAIWWTEHVLRYGGARHVRSPAANMSWAEYYELNLILLLLAIFFTIVIVSCVALHYAIKFIVTNILPSMKLKVL